MVARAGLCSLTVLEATLGQRDAVWLVQQEADNSTEI